jgi:hypothetical protein
MGVIRYMKDMFGKEIEAGDYVIYIQAFGSQHVEKAIVVESSEKYIKIEYIGMSTYPLQEYCKKKGSKSRLTITDKKVIVINSKEGDTRGKDIYKEERERFETELKKNKQKLDKEVKIKDKLLEENKLLQAKVDKINNRWEILDI